MVNFGPLAAEIVSLVWGTAGNFNWFRVLVALLHGTLVVGVSQTAALNRGRHLYSAGRPSRWALAHISSFCLLWPVTCIARGNWHYAIGTLYLYRIYVLTPMLSYYYLFITPCGSTYKIYKSIYKKHTIHSIKENYKLGLQFIHCYEKIAVSTKCRHKLRFSSATPEHRLRMEYFDNILPYSCVHIAEKDRITLLSHVRIFFINSNFR